MVEENRIKIPLMWHEVPHVVLQPDQKGLQFKINRKQALRVLDMLIQRLGERGIPYNYALVPQAGHTLPKMFQNKLNADYDHKQHAIFLFVLCLWMRGGTESDTAIEFLTPMYEKDQKLFAPEYFLQTDTPGLIAEVATALTEANLGNRVDENSVGWVYNMRKIARHWGGDPRKLMNDKPKFKKLCKRIVSKKPKTDDDLVLLNEGNPNGYMYFQEKMAGMIAYFLMDAELVPMFYAPVPVDIHVLRVLVINQVIKPVGKCEKETLGVDFYREEVRALAREVTEWYCRTRHVSPVALCDTLWLLSRSLCRRNPGNSGYVVDTKRHKNDRLRRKQNRDGLLSPHLLGMEDVIEGDVLTLVPSESDDGAGELSGRKRYMGFRFSDDTIWNDPGRIRRYEAACGRCPLESTCRFNVTSAAYYVAGKLLVERERLKAPRDHRSFLDHDAFASAHHVRIDPRVRFAPIAFVES